MNRVNEIISNNHNPEDRLVALEALMVELKDEYNKSVKEYTYLCDLTSATTKLSGLDPAYSELDNRAWELLKAAEDSRILERLDDEMFEVQEYINNKGRELL